LFLPAVLSRDVLAWSYAEMGTFTESRTFGEEGLQTAEAAAHPASIMYASWTLGLLCLRQNDLPRALLQLERAMGICQDAVLPAFFPRIAAALSEAYALSGRLADALSLLAKAMVQTTARERDLVGYQTLYHLSMGEVRLLAGHLEEAHALVECALVLAREHQERGHQAYALRLLGEIAVHRTPPDVDKAAAHYHQALALAKELGMRPLVAHCHHGLGRLYYQTGRAEPARTALAAAVDLYRAMEMTYWLPQAEVALAQTEGR
jgi:tetratricopeptide (TPR) repeat protein